MFHERSGKDDTAAVQCPVCKRMGHSTILFKGVLLGEIKCRKCGAILRGEVRMSVASNN